MQFTQEQEAIIHHPLGKHARVLAVAGSGKTTTMVQRIKYLVENLHEDPRWIRVVMFNRLAREQFEEKLAKVILSPAKRPKVLTFHALAYSMYRDAEKQGLLPAKYQLWIEDKAELAYINVLRAIESLLNDNLLMDDIDPEEALDAIGLWKASLIPPEHAGHRVNSDLELVYRRFEELREEQRALTFDDFVPTALRLMNLHPQFRRRFEDRLDHLIVDEYQDINYGQQQMIRLIAGERADVMVVGDDDQTIYEWRAARPYYILQGFMEDFSNKPVVDYTLSHSFRFGPEIAQMAYNVITFNTNRADKSLIAHQPKPSTVALLENTSEQSTEVEKAMAEEIVTLVKERIAAPKDIIVLGRTFLQMDGLQAAFLEKKVPFRIIGKPPFFERDENRTLIDYMRLALALDQHPSALKPWFIHDRQGDRDTSVQERDTSYYRWHKKRGSYDETIRTFLAIANTPSRKLLRSTLMKAIEAGGRQGKTIRQSLALLLDEKESPWPEERREKFQELFDVLARISERIRDDPKWSAGDALRWLVETLDYLQHFETYYGEGTASDQRIASVNIFIGFAKRTGMLITKFIDYLSKLDTTWGQSPERTITMTTVHRTKGLEYDYVFIPNATEGHMPVHIANEEGIYDKSGTVPEHPHSPPLESERRLFYVAITRAKSHLYIGVNSPPMRGLQSQSSIPLPSRFIEEMQIEDTNETISALRKCVEKGNPAALLNLVKQKHVSKNILRYVVERYLKPEVTQQQFTNTLVEIDALPDFQFQYQHKYPPIETIAGKRQTEPPSPPAWAEDEDIWAWIS